MKRYVINRIEGNKVTVLAMYDDIDTARKEGKRIYDSIPEKCMIDCIQAEVDEEGHVDRSRFKLYECWF